MDIKTLKYMEDRVEQGKAIMSEIDKLVRLKSDAGLADTAKFQSHSKLAVVENHKIVSELKQTLDDLIDEEVGRLKDEFAKL